MCSAPHQIKFSVVVVNEVGVDYPELDLLALEEVVNSLLALANHRFGLTGLQPGRIDAFVQSKFKVLEIVGEV